MSTVAPAAAGPLSARRRVADVLQPFVPPGMRMGRVDLWRGGAALKGRAPDAEIPALLDRLRTQVPWLESHSSIVGNGRF